ncbi:hypothetical protein P3X46_001837 [Hevea brasiliensis]|uniref:Aspartic peptidase DDI1-type domain-containing protein n=1 Tax=Hevea brasiliensis TaxID=3981 RepID=A0ABQ9NEK6_HEVBR|nr:hypothetical protein P3X46_001837 [Hevea brasiliensis]
MLVQHFYNSVSPAIRSIIDASSGGDLMEKLEDEAYSALDKIAYNNYQWSCERNEMKKPSADEDKNESTSNHDEVNEEANKKKEVEKEEEEKYVPPPPYKPPLPYPQRFPEAKLDKQFEKFLENKLPLKLKDPGSFVIPCYIGDTSIDKALCDLGASVSLMPLSICEKLKVGELKPTTISLQLADRSIKYPVGILENIPARDKVVNSPLEVTHDLTIQQKVRN